MIVYRDRCYCNVERCQRYRKCKDSYYSAVKEQENCPNITSRMLPIDTCDMSSICDHFVEVAKMVGE